VHGNIGLWGCFPFVTLNLPERLGVQAPKWYWRQHEKCSLVFCIHPWIRGHGRTSCLLAPFGALGFLQEFTVTDFWGSDQPWLPPQLQGPWSNVDCARSAGRPPIFLGGGPSLRPHPLPTLTGDHTTTARLGFFLFPRMEARDSPGIHPVSDCQMLLYFVAVSHSTSKAPQVWLMGGPWPPCAC
jgi:hypothetical protein